MTATAGFLIAVSLVLILAVLIEVRRAHIRVESLSVPPPERGAPWAETLREIAIG